MSGKPTTLAIEKLAYVTENVPAAPEASVPDYTNYHIGWPPTQILGFGHIYVGERSHAFPAYVSQYITDTHTWIPASGVPVEFSVNTDTITLELPEPNTTDDDGLVSVYLIPETVGNYVVTAQIKGTQRKFTMLAFVRVNPNAKTDNPLPVDDPVEDPVDDPVDDSVDDDPVPPVVKLPTPRGAYVVWLGEVDGSCQSGVIHGDYVYIDTGNKTLTFTGQDGEVDPGDTVREYIKVETGYTYEQASKRASEILKECPL